MAIERERRDGARCKRTEDKDSEDAGGGKRLVEEEGKNGRASGAKLAAREGARHRVYKPTLD